MSAIFLCIRPVSSAFARGARQAQAIYRISTSIVEVTLTCSASFSPISQSILVIVGQLQKWKLSNEVEKKQWRLSFIHGIKIISNKLLNFMFTYIEQYIYQTLLLYTFIIGLPGYLIALTLSSTLALNVNVLTPDT